MEFKFDSEVYSKLKKQRRRRAWKRILSAMMCLVVFCTTYVLILPAITKETDVFCGIEEHTHSDKCYERVLLCENHEHSEECYETLSELICTEPTDAVHVHTDECVPVYESVLICEEVESAGHTHGENCGAVITDEVVCGLEETEGHVHGEECFTETTLFVCGIEESAGHTHGEGCEAAVSGEAICGQEETEDHVHGDSCYIVTYSCGMEESAGHTHGESCETETQTVLTCELEEKQSHAHDEHCFAVTYGCGTEESAGHVHGESCYTEISVYSCGFEENEAIHSHGEGCYENKKHLICAFAEMQDHKHTEECYASELICEKTEHSHGVACFADPNADVETAEKWEAALPGLTGNRAEDVLAIARSQLGYTESEKNYIVEEDNSIKGYTRYGQWYGDPYGDWDGMFASFCYRYAGAEELPTNADSASWLYELQQKDLFRITSEYIPKAGDLIILDGDLDGNADRVGLVEKLEDINLTVIEGNSNDQVKCNTYDLFDKSIIGFGALAEVRLSAAEETDDPAADEPEQPSEDAEQTIGPNDTDAWAVLVYPEETAETSAESVSGEEPASRTYSLRRSANTYVMPRAGTPLDLTPYINAVTMYDEKGNVLPSGSTVSEGDIIEFKIEYTIAGQQLGVMNGEDVTVKSDTLTYALPQILEVIRSDSGNILNSAGVTVGTYVIDSETGTIIMSFTEDYVKENAQGMQIHGNISFYSTVTKIDDTDEEHQDYKFTDKITLGVVIEEEKEVVGDLKIEKQKTEVNGEEIIYQVTVTSSEGTNGPITITDKMSKGLKFVEGISVERAGGSDVNNVSFNASTDGSSFTLELPEMSPGSSYTVTYKCRADIELLDADMTVRNTATVNGKDSEGFDLEDEVTVDHNFEMLKKTGEKNEDGTISWTITVNQAKADISGWILEDIMGGNQPYTGTVTIKDSNGAVLATNQRLPYTFPEGSKSTYAITYTTSHGFEDGDTVYNKAILKDDDTDITVVTGVGIGTPFTKSGEAGEIIQDENGTNLLPITWTVTIDTLIGPITAGEVIYDKMNGAYHQADMYMTYDQVMAVLATIEAELERVGSSVSYASAEAFVAGSASGENYNLSELNGSPECRDLLYERFSVQLGKDIPKGQILTFSYEGYGIFPNNLVEETVFQNRIGLVNRFEIEATVKFTGGTVKATKFAMKPYDPNSSANQDWALDWGAPPSRYNYSDLHDSYLAWAIELKVSAGYAGTDDFVLYEDLPEGVTVRGLDLPFLLDVPTKRLVMRNMAPGNTYYWTFDLYSLEQYAYGTWYGEEGVETTITVKVTEDGDLEIHIPGEVFYTMGQFVQFYNSLDWQAPLDESYGYLYIYTQIDDDFEWTPREEGSYVYVNSFENRFTLENENGDLVDIGSQTQEITKDEREGVIRKEATSDNNNIITYSVVLNAYGRDLIEHSGTLNIHDELVYQSSAAKPLRLRLVPGSVKLYEIRLASDGSYTKLGEVNANYNYAETSSEQGEITSWVHTIDLNVPDNKALLLEYSYKASGNKDAVHEVNNVCTITGVGEGSIDGEHKVEIEVKEATAQADIKGVMIYKVDAGNNGVFLENAKFNIYIWNAEQNKYIIVHHPDNGGTEFTTDANGLIVLDNTTMGDEQFAYNTAYYIVEVESPEGYYISPEKYYFYIVHENTEVYRPNIPSDFHGQGLVSGDIIYRNNVSHLTEITVEKYWKDYNGNYVTVTGSQVPKITLELWQMLEGDPSSARVYGTYTVTPDEKGNWSLTVNNLPKATEKADGTKDKDYLYYVKEVNSGRYFMESTENNGGINSGIIKIVNRETDGYVLPETGGAGTQMYTAAGIGLIGISTACLVYRRIKRRREGANSS